LDEGACFRKTSAYQRQREVKSIFLIERSSYTSFHSVSTEQAHRDREIELIDSLRRESVLSITLSISKTYASEFLIC
jgi:hypothetical protein